MLLVQRKRGNNKSENPMDYKIRELNQQEVKFGYICYIAFERL